MASFAISYWAMLPDTVEFNEWKFGERNEVRSAGFGAFSNKAALAANTMLLGQILGMAGFVANHPQRIDTRQHQGRHVLHPLAGWRAVLSGLAMEVSNHAGFPPSHGGGHRPTPPTAMMARSLKP
ncbi:MFS transporter [Paraburkholderia nemoris]|uniref:MFS transporter n=1 Tax=Paraburkholderia nemoris TaxID=2793076 RepID=UPI001B8B887B|nr:MFS transporter [Paraburkholderia nemoris]